MCRFCVEHGEGERWYLNASNYAFDLQSDLKRREYVVSFIRDFDKTRSNALAWMERLGMLPTPLERAAKAAVSRRMQSSHFGQPVPIEECEQIISLASSVTVIPCICRMHAPGKAAEEVCMLVTTQPIEPHLLKGFESYRNGPDLSDFHRIDAAQAASLLRECEDRGLMHSVWTFQTPFTAAICNCNLESGCMAMRLTAGYGMKMMWRGEWVASIDDEACASCGACAMRCPFDAIDSDVGGRVTLHVTRCWGCGICRSACSRGAISLLDRRSVPEVATVW